MNSVSLENEKVIKIGSWGKVALVDQDTTTSQDLMHHRTRRGIIGLVRSFFGYRNGSPLLINTAGFANHVIQEGKIGSNDTTLLTEMPQERDGYHLSILMSSVHMEYGDLEKDVKTQTGKPKPYELGLYLADMFEVLPPSLAARILMVSSDPEISQATVNGEKNSATNGVDILEMSVEGLVLLPNQARHDIFRDLARMHPTRDGRASRLLSLIGSDWYDHMRSAYSGYGVINANLKAQKEPAEIHEFAIKTFSDLTACRRVVEGEINK